MKNQQPKTSELRNYKSVQTFEKLHKIKSNEPEIYLGNYTEIEKKLEQFCEKAQYEMFPEDVVMKQHKSKQALSKKQEQLNKDVGENFNNLIDIEMKNQLKKTLISEGKEVNPLVDMFGNALIATVFQSLLIKTIENLYSVKLKVGSDLPISSNVLKAFEISIQMINQYQTKEEKQNYILQCMESKIDQLLKDQNKDIKAHQRASEEYLLEFGQRRELQNEDNYFPWLKINTKYNALKKRLRDQIIEKINEYNNMNIINKTLNNEEMLKSTKKMSDTKKLHTDIEGVNYTTTKDIFLNMHQYGDPKTKQFLSRLGLDKKKQQQEENNKKKQLEQNLLDDQILNDYLGEGKNTLLEKYRDGYKLTEEELKFMANTSELLNKCLDKQYVQQASDAIEPSIVDNQNRKQYIKEKLDEHHKKFSELEQRQQRERMVQINTQIQKRYHKMLETLVKKLERDGQFDQQPPKDVKGAQTLHKFLQGEIDEYQLIRTIKKLAYQQEQQKKMNVDGQKQTQKQMDEEELDQLQKKYHKEKIEKEKEKKEKLNQLAKPNRDFAKGQTKEIKRHYYHPNSKIFINPLKEDEFGDNEQISDFRKQQIENKLQQHKKEQELFKLHLKSDRKLRQPYRFFQHNTGGPLKPDRPEPFFNPMEIDKPMVVTQSEIQKIIKIQKNFRAHYLKKKFKQQREKNQENLREEPDIKISIENGDAKIQNLRITTKKEEKELEKQREQEKQKNRELYQKKLEIQTNTNLQQQKMKNHADQSYEANTPNNNNHKNQNHNEQEFSRSHSIQRFSVFKRPSKRINFGSIIQNNSQIMCSQKNNNHQTSQLELTNIQNLYKYDSVKTLKRPISSKLFGTRASSIQFSRYAGGPQKMQYSTVVQDSKQNVQQSIQQQKSKESEVYQMSIKRTKLFEAALKNRFWMIDVSNFVYNEQDLNSKDREGNTVLHYVTKFGNIEFMEWVLNRGADPNIPNKNLNTSMHIAFKTQKYDVIRLLLNYGGDLNSLNEKMQTPLAFGKDRIIRLLHLQNGTKSVKNEDLIFDNNQYIQTVKNSDDISTDVEMSQQINQSNCQDKMNFSNVQNVKHNYSKKQSISKINFDI
ncbi:Ankyrin repeat-containing domain [Pseudocohnilembus persalinus]|uniref:Ankyrin repeat-containing domain n=1 Tax=Pseudocohnilembus persalinus TaxID=266149 RepID=A0A0V0QMV8_PSEPJ|nr:Ankyrin repeat-containing domain [Pseudocohnilembus persalinus]|eukprot:KRX03565.1 Ankyrin repeat-containing domain [Pseudocohnilembus persalinus]